MVQGLRNPSPLMHANAAEPYREVDAIPSHFLLRAEELPKSCGHESGESGEVYCNELADTSLLQLSIRRSERDLQSRPWPSHP